MIDVLETKHGTFTNNEVMGWSAEEAYQEWLKNEENKIDICHEEKPKSLEEQVQDLQKEKEQLWETVQFLLKKTGMIGDEKDATN